ncbi:MAG: hypothetical protein ACLQGP_19850 [Isosphaeraceae bacterium]
MSLCHEQWPPLCLDCEEQAECWFITLVDNLAEGNARVAARALGELAELGWVVSYIGTTAPTLRRRNDAVFWFTTLDLVSAHGKFSEVAKIQRKLARLGWVVSRIEPCTADDGRGGGR